MSCPEKNRSFANKPNLTKTMRKKGMSYVWREVMGNPNLYCWIPASKKNNIENIDIGEETPKSKTKNRTWLIRA